MSLLDKIKEATYDSEFFPACKTLEPNAMYVLNVTRIEEVDGVGQYLEGKKVVEMEFTVSTTDKKFDTSKTYKKQWKFTSVFMNKLKELKGNTLEKVPYTITVQNYQDAYKKDERELRLVMNTQTP